MEYMKLEYRTSSRAKRLRIAVRVGGDVVVTVPQRMSLLRARFFVASKMSWIRKNVAQMQFDVSRTLPKSSRVEFLARKAAASELVHRRLQKLNESYEFCIGSIAIKNTKTRWGSCSKKGNLNFHYQIAALSEELADYLMVHELCHIKEMNHSTRFWNLVASTIPDFRKRRKELKRIRL